MIKSVIWLKGSHLETVPQTQRSIKEITCLTKQKSQGCQNGGLGQTNLRCVKQKCSFSQRVFENWSYLTVSIITQASYKHQLLKITVRISHFGVPYGTGASFKFILIDKLTPVYKRSCWDWLFDQVWCSKIEQESSYDSWNMVKDPYKRL